MKAATLAPLLWLLLVLVLIPAVLLAVKRSGLATRLAGALAGRFGVPVVLPQLVLRESLAIGPNQRVVAVEVGSGAERQWLLLGVTAQQISTLHTMVAPAEARREPFTLAPVVLHDGAACGPATRPHAGETRGTP
jgi:flagellar protein FliO/FliZ